jgi:hypothetical protein
MKIHDELRHGLTESAARMYPGQAPVRSIVRRARRRSSLRKASIAVGSIAIAGLAIVPVLFLSGLSSDQTDGRGESTSAPADGVAVLAEDVAISTVTPGEDGTIAFGVRFVVRWPDEASSEAPPLQGCEVALTRPNGEPVPVEQVDNSFNVSDGKRVEDGATIIGPTSAQELPDVLNDLVHTWRVDVSCSPLGDV